MTASGAIPGSAANLKTYDAPEVADHYAALDYLTPCEHLLFEAYIPAGSTILDLGVGGGRTTGYLASHALRYVGVDYAAAMVDACRRKFPELEFKVADAADLEIFQDASFEAVVFSFNGLDMLSNDARRGCLQHVHRVLKAGGLFIFSSHNPRAFLVRRSWNRERVKRVARRFSFGSKILYFFAWNVLAGVRAILAAGQTIGATAVRAVTRVPSSLFWRGEGTRMDSAHGGLMTHYWTPPHVTRELTSFHFQPVRVLGDDYPRRSHVLSTDWYYYVFTKPVSIKSSEK